MKTSGFLLTLFMALQLQGQVFEFESSEGNQVYNHRILMDDSYVIEAIYESNPPVFILTRGGYYQKQGKTVFASLEFNSNFEKDQFKTFQWDSSNWKAKNKQRQVLDGKWLMAGRVKSEGEQRRDITRSRKTMKFLIDGCFQWTAFNTETFQFFGSGGGEYTAENGAYVEQIEYFSRDNSRVGAKLSFEYLRKEKDWYHKGFSSKGASLHEIWTLRPSQ